MKKFVAFVLVCMCIVSMAACVDDVETETGLNDVGDSIKDLVDDVVGSVVGDKDNKASFNEVVIVDNDQIKITITEFDDAELFGPTFSCLLENKTDKTLMFTLEDVSVNDFMCDPLFAEEIDAGKKAYSDFSWFDEDLENCGINYIETVDGVFRVYDSNDWLADDLYNDKFELNVQNTSTEASVSERVFDGSFEEQVIVDNSELKIVARGFDNEGFFGPTLICYIENKTDKTVMVSMDDVSVNGFMCDPFWATEIVSGKKVYSEISWFKDDLEESKIEKIESVECTFSARDSEDWLADDILNKKVVITVK